MEVFLISLLTSVLGSLMGIIVILFIEHKRLPSLRISTNQEVHSDERYGPGHVHTNERWKFFRVAVRNESLPGLLRWLTRQTAENCHATIEVTLETGEALYTMRGRWVATPQLPHIPQEAIVKLLHPDPVSIRAGDTEALDVFTKREGDPEAYGWNNEAYLNDWRTPEYRLNLGTYNARITIKSQNGVSNAKLFVLEIRETIESSSIRGAD